MDWSIDQVRSAVADELQSGALSPVNAAIDVSWVRLSAAERQLLLELEPLPSAGPELRRQPMSSAIPGRWSTEESWSWS